MRSRPVMGNRGHVLESLGRLDEAVQQYEEMLRLRPGDAAAAKWLESARARLDAMNIARLLEEGTALTKKGEYRRAGEALVRVLAAVDETLAPLAEAERAKRLADPNLRAALVGAHYNLACVRAVASLGKEGPNAEAKAIEVAEATRLRDAAFEELGKCLDFGGGNADLLANDPDLAALHDDPRWTQFLARATR